MPRGAIPAVEPNTRGPHRRPELVQVMPFASPFVQHVDFGGEEVDAVAGTPCAADSTRLACDQTTELGIALNAHDQGRTAIEDALIIDAMTGSHCDPSPFAIFLMNNPIANDSWTGERTELRKVSTRVTGLDRVQAGGVGAGEDHDARADIEGDESLP